VRPLFLWEEKMKKANLVIRSHAYKSGVYLYEVAAKLGMNDGNFSRLLRFELPEKKKAEVLTLIDRLAKDKNHVATEIRRMHD